VKGYWGLLNRSDQTVLSTLGPTRDFQPGATICHERVLALRGDGDIVGELAGETTGHRTATVQAIDPVRALIVGYDRFNVFLDSHPEAGHAYRRALAQRLSDTATRLRRHSVTSGAQRVAALLLEFAGRPDGEGNGEIQIAMPLSQQELASLAGTSRAPVTRALSDWRQRGLIRTGQRHITITEPRRLRQIADQAS
jgi:CRP/FNR family cyclic AMP-dependent transcriptional regulator